MSARLELADAPALARATRRTRATRIALALALAGLVAAAAVTAAQGEAPPAKAAVVPRKNVEIVLDLSGSVMSDKGGIAGGALRFLQRQARGGTVGLVLFSDSAEETLPPGSSPAQLDPFIRYFSSPRRPAKNPWSNGFSAGTAISKGIAAAREALTRDHVGGRVVIVSDLGDAYTDRRALVSALRALKATRGVQATVFPLPVTDTTILTLVRRILGSNSVLRVAAQPPRAEHVRSTPFPLTLVTLAALAALAIAANELLAVSLRWRTA
jgi:hypothetical protein